MKKIFITSFFFFILKINFAQNKKEQIYLLQNRIDSIRIVYDNEKLNNNKLSSTIDSVTKLIVNEIKLIKKIDSINTDLKNKIDFNLRKFDSLNLLNQQRFYSINDSNLQEVAFCYNHLVINRNFQKAYNLISSKSKDNLTFNQYEQILNKFWNRVLSFNANIDSFIEIKTNIEYPNYRRFRLKFLITESNEKYYSSSSSYQTYIKENNVWRRVFTSHLFDSALEKTKSNDYEGAIKLINEILSFNPFDGKAYNLLVKCHNFLKVFESNINAKQTRIKILNYLKYMIELEPDYPDHYILMSSYYWNIKNYNLAIENFNKAFKYAPSNELKSRVLRYLGELYIEKLDEINGVKFLNHSLKLDSSNYYTYFSLALYHINKNDYYTAIDFFNKINESQFFNQIKLDYISDTDTEPLYYYQYSLALMNTNNEELAKSVIKKARDLFPNKNNIEELYIEIFNIIPVDTTSSY